ncbi:MAG TPA: hypothetical protein VMP08_10445 [Anaerolineae bacterium]|nr:hypothetical protein [Anaerolineae bacterium]
MLTSPVVRYRVTIEGETADIGTANELAIALDVLHGQHDRAILAQLQPHLADIVGNAIGLTNVLRSLESADQIFLIQSVGTQLPVVLQDARFLRDLFAILADDAVEQCLIETLGTTGLRKLILTAAELSETLEWVYGQRDQQILDLLGAPYLKRLIRNGEDLALVLNGLAEPAQANLIDQLGWPRVIELISDGREFAYLMRALPAELSARLLEYYSRDDLTELIGNQHDWAYVYDRLETAEAAVLMDKLGVNHAA